MSPQMNPQTSDRLHFEMQIAYARPAIALLAISCLLELRAVREAERALALLTAYLVAAVVIIGLERLLRKYNWHLPLACDVLVVGLYLYFSTEIMPAWFLVFFVAFAAGYRWNFKLAMFLSFGLLLLAVALRLNRLTPTDPRPSAFFYLPVFAATLMGAGGMAFLGDRNRRFTEQQEFLNKVSGTMHVEIGLAESLRLLLEDLCGEFHTEGSAAGLPRCRPGADFPVAVQIRRKRTAESGQPTTDARGWVFAGRSGCFPVLELARGARIRLRLGPAKHAGAENPASDSRANATGVSDPEFSFRGVRPVRPTSWTVVPGEPAERPAGVQQGRTGVV